MHNNILITGASGQLGRRILHHLLESERVDPTQIIATSRNPAALGALAARGVTVRRADFDDASSLEAAFAGAGSVLIISTDLIDLSGGARLRQHQQAVAAAKAAGAQHLSYTSMLYPEPGSPMPFASDHFGAEEAIKASGIAYSIFQNNAYFENLFLVLPTTLAAGRWYTSAGEGRTAYVARDDIAAAIAARLASRPVDRQSFALTGASAYSNAEVAGIATKVTGRPIELVEVTGDEFKMRLESVGVPKDFAMLNAAVDANARAGKADLVNDAIMALIHREPLSLQAFLEANKAKLLS